MRLNRLLAVSFVVCSIVFLPLQAEAGEFAGDVNFFLGIKYLEDGWSPLENQGAFGVEMSWGNTDWPVSIASDVFVSADYQDNLVFDDIAVTTELDLGVRKIWDVGRTHPFVGGGIGIFTGIVDRDLIDDSDATIGPWIHGGVFWRLGSKFNIGVSARWSRGEVEIFGTDLDAGGLQVGLLLGFGWPGQS